MEKRRVIVCGSRRWRDRDLIATVLSELMIKRGWDPLIVHGACPRGADKIAEQEAGKLGFQTEPHPPDYIRHGRKRAPHIRNAEMAKLGASLCIAFWDGKSTGTESMMEKAKKHDIPVEIYPSEAWVAETRWKFGL